MPLVLEMKAGDKIIINGAVVELNSSHAKLIVHNQVSILRGKEIISEEEAATPAARVYFALQNAYMFPQHAEAYLKQFSTFIDQYVQSCPSAADLVSKIKAEVENGQLYRALKKSQELLLHQNKVLQDLEAQLQKQSTDEV